MRVRLASSTVACEVVGLNSKSTMCRIGISRSRSCGRSIGLCWLTKILTMQSRRMGRFAVYTSPCATV